MLKRIRQLVKQRRSGLLGTLAVTASIGTLSVLLVLGIGQTDSGSATDFSMTPSTLADVHPAIPLSVPDLVDKLAPTVVNFRVTKVQTAGLEGFRMPDGPFGDFFERYFGRTPQEMEPRRTDGAGSGVIISEDGYLLTNNHVIEGATEVTVTLANKSEHEASVIGRDPKTDLAVLKIEGSGPFPKAVLGNSEKLRVGESVIAIGNPFGLGHTVTAGIVSAKGRFIGAGPYDDFIQTDASINPGNSGGPLFNTRGEVVGINTAIIPNGQGIGFAIPINTAKPLVPQLIDDGKVTRGYLGVTIQPISKDLAGALGLEDTDGALVADVVPGGPADKGGVETADVIRSFNGTPVKESHELPALVANTPVGEKAELVVTRDGRERSLSVEVAELDSKTATSREGQAESRTSWGLQLQDLTPQTASQLGIKANEGVLVMGVQPGSPAERAGLHRGDVIVEVDRVAVLSVDDAIAAIGEHREDTLLLTIQRGDGRLFVALTEED